MDLSYLKIYFSVLPNPDSELIQQQPTKGPNGECLACIDLGEPCGYCDTKYEDHVAHCEELIKKWGIEEEYEVVVADDYHIQVDCDKVEDAKECLKRLKMLAEAVEIVGYKITRSKSGNRHVIIKTKQPWNAYSRIAMQAILGSDPIREMLNFTATVKNHKNPILLIEAKRTKLQEYSEL